MGRVFFPTYSLNRFGARDLDQRATLGALGDPGPARFPAEPTPRAAMTPTPSILGAIVANGASYLYRGVYPVDGVWPGPMPVWPGPPSVAPISRPITTGPISSSGGGGSAPTPPTPPTPAPIAAAVSSQVGPTPTVTLPPPSPSAPLLISSGGGTQSVSTPTVVAAPSGGFVEGIAAWLGGSTTLFNYNVPNAVIAAVVVLGFAWLSSSGKKR